MEVVMKLLAVFRLKKIPYSFLIGLITLLIIILFISDELAGQLAIKDFRNQYRIYLGPALPLTIVILITKICAGIAGDRASKKYWESKCEILHELTFPEKHILTQFLHGAGSVKANIGDGIMGGLIAKEIVYQSSSVTFDLAFPYNIQPWAKKYLQENPDLLN